MAETLDRLGAFTITFFGVLVALALLVVFVHSLMAGPGGKPCQKSYSDGALRGAGERQEASALPLLLANSRPAVSDLSTAPPPAPRHAAPLNVVSAMPPPRQGAPLAITPCNDKGPRLRRGAPLRVSHNAPLWAEKGWRETPEGYAGAFRTAGRQWRGLIEIPYPDAYHALIWQPPLDALAGHPHRPCFRRNGYGTECYEVHYRDMPQSLDHAITTVELVLADAFAKGGAGCG